MHSSRRSGSAQRMAEDAGAGDRRAERIGLPYSISPLPKKLAVIRPEYIGVDQVDRVSYEPGEIAQGDLWLPDTKGQVAPGRQRILAVLVMPLGLSRFLTADLIPTLQGGDILSAMWSLICGIGRSPRAGLESEFRDR